MAGEDLPPGLLGVLPRMGEPGWYPGIEEDARASTLSTLAPPPQDPRAAGVAPFSGLPPTPGYTEARTADPEFRDADLSQRLRDDGHRDIERMTGDRPGTFASNTMLGLASPATINPARLPMDAASRAARAAEQGYTVEAYKGMYPETGHRLVRENGQWVERGTRRPITEFNNPDSPYAGFFSDSPEVANRFASSMGAGGAVYPARLRFENPVVIDAGGRPAAAFQFESVARQHGALEDMARFRGAFAEGSRADGVILRNTADEGTVYIPRAPQQARSAFARFDPRQRNNADMLGAPALGLLGVGAASGGGSSQ